MFESLYVTVESVPQKIAFSENFSSSLARILCITRTFRVYTGFLERPKSKGIVSL